MTSALHRLRLSIFAEFPVILRIRYIVMIGGVYCVYDVIWLILCGKCFHQIRDQTEQLLDKLSRTSSPDESNYDLFHPRGLRKLLKGKRRSLKNRRQSSRIYCKFLPIITTKCCQRFHGQGCKLFRDNPNKTLSSC